MKDIPCFGFLRGDYVVSQSVFTNCPLKKKFDTNDVDVFKAGLP